MTPILENAVLGTDLNCKSFALLNVGAILPMPDNVADSEDPRLTDAREPLPGSVTNASVSATAAIAQSKLLLDGDIPTAWLGTSSTTAARGDLAEYLSNKGALNGYASLDATGKVPIAQLPAEIGTGTVTSVGLAMPSQFSISGPNPITTSGVFNVAWVDVANLAWFGNKEGSAGPPHFYTTALPVSLIPNLTAAKVVSGEFDPARLPLAVHGTGHQAGAIPDPGSGGTATDYLARDMTYKPIPTSTGPTYYPVIPNPILSKTTPVSGETTVSIREDLETPPTTGVDGCTFFYSTTSPGTSGFQEFPAVAYVKVPATGTLWAYASRPGYKNSAIVPITLT